MSKSNNPPIDPSDISANQKAMFGTQTFDVKQQFQQDQNHVTIPSVDSNGFNNSMLSSFTKEAPNLPFKLFGLEKLFKKSPEGDAS